MNVVRVVLFGAFCLSAIACCAQQTSTQIPDAPPPPGDEVGESELFTADTRRKIP